MTFLQKKTPQSFFKVWVFQRKLLKLISCYFLMHANKKMMSNAINRGRNAVLNKLTHCLKHQFFISLLHRIKIIPKLQQSMINIFKMCTTRILTKVNPFTKTRENILYHVVGDTTNNFIYCCSLLIISFWIRSIRRIFNVTQKKIITRT